MKEEDYILYKVKTLCEFEEIAVAPYGKWGRRVEQILLSKGRKVKCFDNFFFGGDREDM